MPGADVLLEKIIAEGLRPVLVTGSGQKSLLESLNKDYPGVFAPEYMVTAFDVKYGKPHPEPYLIGMKKSHAKPWEAIVVENAPLGVEAGVASGAFTHSSKYRPSRMKSYGLPALMYYIIPCRIWPTISANYRKLLRIRL